MQSRTAGRTLWQATTLGLVVLATRWSSAQPASDQAAANAPAPATAPAPAAPRPPLQMLQWDQDGYYYRAKIRPGVARPGEALEVVLDVARMLTTPDPQFGDRKPLASAELRAVIYRLDAPAPAKGGKGPAPTALGRQLVPMRDRGSFGLHVTLATPGVYGLDIQGATPEYAQPIALRLVLPVDVWPVPPELKSPSPPAAAPASYERADLIAGRALCVKRCRTDLPWAHPAGQLPAFLDSADALALDDGELLRAFAGDDAERHLSLLEQIDLVHYLRSLHYEVASFFPQATRYTIKRYTIDAHGQDRLRESLKGPPPAGLLEAAVVTAYKPADTSGRAALVHQVPRLLDGLKPKDKVGYLVFSRYPADPQVAELALVLDTSFVIQGVRLRDPAGVPLAALEKALAGYAGKGRFNDPASLKKGPAAPFKAFLPVYLAAAEAATMFVREENDRFSFDTALAE